MEFGPIPNGQPTAEEVPNKEADRVTERDHAVIARSRSSERPARPGFLQRLGLFLRRA